MKKKSIENGITERRDRNITDTGVIEGIEKEPSLPNIVRQLELGLPADLNRETVMLGAEKRKLSAPKEIDKEGIRRGKWLNFCFSFDDKYVPKAFNDAGKDITSIKKELRDKYGITLGEIPYVDGAADFSGISLAHIPLIDVITAASDISKVKYEKLSQAEKVKELHKIFTDRRRKTNFKIADQIAADRHVFIPQLGDDYSAIDLGNWREDHKFTWDEQLSNGYELVPAVIHGNIRHTGLVSTVKTAYANRKKRKRKLKHDPGFYSWDGENAPASIGELFNYYENHGGKKMPIGRRVGGRGEISYNELKDETKEYIKEKEKLGELGEKFEKDKEKIEDMKEKVRNLAIAGFDVAPILYELDIAEELLEEQYDDDVADGDAAVDVKIRENFDEMNEASERLDEQAEELRNAGLTVAARDLSAAADKAVDKSREFQAMKEEFDKEAQELIELARQQKERMHTRRR